MQFFNNSREEETWSSSSTFSNLVSWNLNQEQLILLLQQNASLLLTALDLSKDKRGNLIISGLFESGSG